MTSGCATAMVVMTSEELVPDVILAAWPCMWLSMAALWFTLDWTEVYILNIIFHKHDKRNCDFEMIRVSLYTINYTHHIALLYHPL